MGRLIGWHSQNLNEDRDGNPKGSILRHGGEDWKPSGKIWSHHRTEDSDAKSV